jgi:uncharacterized membrane protein YcaP (DUF421 family)
MDTQDLLMTAGRSVLVYAFVLVVIRILGKREVGNVTAFDLLTALMIGEVVDEAIFGDVSLLKGAIAVGTIGLLHWLNSWLSYKSDFFDRLTGSEPTVLVRHGKILEDALASERMNRSELESELRLQGLSLDELTEVKEATLEPNGQVSVLKEEWAKELQKGDLRSARQAS